MERLLHKTLQIVLGCAVALCAVPARVEAHSGGCSTVKVSNGFFTQTGGGNTFSTTATGGYQAQINITNYSTATPLTIGNPVTVLPTGLARNKVTITYTITTSTGVTVFDGDETTLQASNLVYTSALPAAYTLFVNVRIQEQSGTRTNTSQYQLSLDISC